jgi:hypothetical protein
MQIDIVASTEDGTVFNIPLNTSSTAAAYDFVRYVNTKDTTQFVQKTNQFKGVTLNFKLSADEKTVVKIYTDYGLLTGRGTANGLNLIIKSLGDFEMYGDFLISSGKFEFTAKDIITKNFTVNQGGTIRWTGNPANAEINLKAVYEVRAPISDLYTAAGVTSGTNSSKQELVQAELLLTKTLSAPQFDFNFNFPNNPGIKDELGTYLSDPTNRSLQAVSLIVQRKFSTPGSNIVNQTAQAAVSEFAFNKLNTLIAQSNIKYLDVNIRSVTDYSASLHFFKDRLLINGSLYDSRVSNDIFGTNNQTTSFSDFTRDFGAQYLIKADGSLLGTYSYRVLNNNTLNNITSQIVTPLYINGVGLVYRRDFDTFGEFFRSIFRRKQAPAKQDTTKKTSSSTPAVLRDEKNDE